MTFEWMITITGFFVSFKQFYYDIEANRTGLLLSGFIKYAITVILHYLCKVFIFFDFELVDIFYVVCSLLSAQHILYQKIFFLRM